MSRRVFYLLIFALLLLPQSHLWASGPLDMPSALKSRKVIGVIYFTNESVDLSRNHLAEIDRIASQVGVQFSPDKIVRIEAYTSRRIRQEDPLNIAFLRAKAVWYYLEKMGLFNSSNLYLTGFHSQQSSSNLQGERVEIAIYDNPFKESMEIYSSN